MTKIRTYQRGETVSIWAEIQNWADAYVNPSEGVIIDLIDPDGTTIDLDADDAEVTSGDMTRSEDGKYYYHYNTSSSSPVGWWRYKCTAQDGTSPAKYTVAEGGFKLE